VNHTLSSLVWRHVGGLQLEQYAGQIYGTPISTITAVFCARFWDSCSGVAENLGLLGCDFSKDPTTFSRLRQAVKEE